MLLTVSLCAARPKTSINSLVELFLHSLAAPDPAIRVVNLHDVVIASWTGRDRPALETRIAELETLGVPRPPSVPLLFRVAGSRVTTNPVIEVIGDNTSGEIEFVLLNFDGRLWVGVGSDHTDRTIESRSAATAKQVCDKPIASELWAFDDVADHWDSLQLRSHLVSPEGTREEYQAGPVTTMLAPHDLLALRDDVVSRQASTHSLMFCGTLATKGRIRPSHRFEVELLDPILGRRIAHAYNIEILPEYLVLR